MTAVVVKINLPVAARAQVYILLGLNWKTACSSRQTELKKRRIRRHGSTFRRVR
jgi:hypothetical protein